MQTIEFYAGTRHLGTKYRSAHKRISQRAAADHRIMDQFKAAHPSCDRATIGTDTFTFDANGNSRSTFKL